jgi:hypothetical protein
MIMAERYMGMVRQIRNAAFTQVDHEAGHDHGSTAGGAWQNKSPNGDAVGQSETGFSRLATLIADDIPLHARKIVRDHECGAGGGWQNKSPNADPVSQAHRLIVEWTASL